MLFPGFQLLPYWFLFRCDSVLSQIFPSFCISLTRSLERGESLFPDSFGPSQQRCPGTYLVLPQLALSSHPHCFLKHIVISTSIFSSNRYHLRLHIILYLHLLCFNKYITMNIVPFHPEPPNNPRPSMSVQALMLEPRLIVSGIVCYTCLAELEFGSESTTVPCASYCASVRQVWCFH